MPRPRVFVTQPIAESALKRLRAVADVEVNPDGSRVLDRATLIEAVKRCDILISLLHDTVDAEVLAANPDLKGVSSMNITQDRIDLAAATMRGIPVTNIPAIVTDATADIGFGLLLAVARNIALGDRLFRSGVYPARNPTISPAQRSPARYWASSVSAALVGRWPAALAALK